MVSCGFLLFKKVRVIGSAYEPTMRFWLTGRDKRNFCLNVSLAAIALLLGRTSQEDEWIDGQTGQERQRVIQGDGRRVLYRSRALRSRLCVVDYCTPSASSRYLPR